MMGYKPFRMVIEGDTCFTCPYRVSVDLSRMRRGMRAGPIPSGTGSRRGKNRSRACIYPCRGWSWEGEALGQPPSTDGVGSLAVSADYARFRAGLARIQGCGLEEEGDRLSLAFEPWFLEGESRLSPPCLRLRFRRAGDRIVLESFTIEAENETRDVSVAAARDALQAWMDYTAD